MARYRGRIDSNLLYLIRVICIASVLVIVYYMMDKGNPYSYLMLIGAPILGLLLSKVVEYILANN